MSVSEKFTLSRPVKHGGAIIKAVMVRPAIAADNETCLASYNKFAKEKGCEPNETRRWIIYIAHICDVPVEAVGKFTARDTLAIAWRIFDLSPSAEAK